MRNRFKYRSKTDRNRIPPKVRTAVFERDGFVCQYCAQRFTKDQLTIDHLIPLSQGGLDEVINYVSCCEPCNQKKGSIPLLDFARQVSIEIEDLPVHGDPIIDNKALPLELRLIRKRIFDKIRRGEIHIGGKAAQKRIEEKFRRSFWQTESGRTLEAEFPLLPGNARISIPQIRTIAKSEREFLLLVELAKSAATRGLLDGVLKPDSDVEGIVRRLGETTRDTALQTRIAWALRRFEQAARKRGVK